MKSSPEKAIEKTFAREEWDKARKLLFKELEKDPCDHWILTRLGTTFYEQKNYPEAYRFHLRAHLLAPECPLVKWDFAGVADALGRHGEAIGIWMDLIRTSHAKAPHERCWEGTEWSDSLINDCKYRIGKAFARMSFYPMATSFYGLYLKGLEQGQQTIYDHEQVQQELKLIEQRIMKMRMLSQHDPTCGFQKDRHPKSRLPHGKSASIKRIEKLEKLFKTQKNSARINDEISSLAYQLESEELAPA